MALPNEYASNLIAALRGGVRDTGRASGYELLPNPVLGYGAIKPRVRPARAALSSPAILRMTPAERRQLAKNENFIERPISESVGVLPLINNPQPGEQPEENPQQAPDTGDETQRLLQRYPTPEIANPFPVYSPQLPEINPLPPLKTPSVTVVPVEPSDLPAIPPIEDPFEQDRETGIYPEWEMPERGSAAFPEDFGYVDDFGYVSLKPASLKPLTPSVDVSQPQDVTNAPAILWNPDELFNIDLELGNIQQSDVREVGTAAFPEDFGYVDPYSVPVVDRSVPSISDANWGMASEALLPDFAVDTAFGIKSVTENPLVSTVFPIASAVGEGLADATLDEQINRLANQYSAIEAGNNLGYGTSVDSSGAVSYQAPVETRDIFGDSYFSPESYFNAYDFGDLSAIEGASFGGYGGGGGSLLDNFRHIVAN